MYNETTVMFENLLVDVQDGVATITLNRPEVFNAFNDAMSYELQAMLKELAKDDAVRILVITGAGKAFCAGQDLKASQGEKNRSLAGSLEKRYNPIIRALRNMPKPIICKLNGAAAGAGFSLALACDLIIANEEAILTEAFIAIGLVLDSGSSYFLPRVVGYAKAFEWSTMATKVKASEAAMFGLVNKSVPADLLDETVSHYASYYAQAPTKAVGLIKKMLNKSFCANLEDMLQYEAYCQEIAGRSEDMQEGVAAFLEKRKPLFKGK